MTSGSTRSVLITGGGRGLGRAIGVRLAEAGAIVGALARTESEVDQTVTLVRDQGGIAIPLVADILDPTSLERAVKRFEAEAGAIDSLVCAAGRLSAIGPLETVDPAAWRLDLETALVGTYQTIRYTLPFLRDSKRGSISVLVGPGHNGELAYASAYAAAQAGLVRLVETLDRELRDSRVRVYAVNPGIVATSLVQNLLDDRDARKWLPRFTETFAEGKEVGPEIVSEMIAWLVDRRPIELSGRVVAAMQSPDFLETRLERVEERDLGVLRVR
jgi:NAD(P)-dependent dehydrogenase (short-subunit alcohol dehydrogenase family)